MPIFLFAKQIVDMLYQYQFLDYAMVLFAVILLGYRLWKDKLFKELKSYINGIDLIVVSLVIIYFLSFLRYPSLYGTFFKVESCFLIYFLGRVYYKEIVENGKFLAYAGYIVIYANFIYRFYQFGWKFILEGPEKTLLNVGGLYYYKTDLAFGILIATLFIYLYGKNNLFKWFTIIVMSSYMVFYSGARMGQVVMAIFYIFIIAREHAMRQNKRFGFNAKYVNRATWVLFALICVFFVIIQWIPYEKLQTLFDLNTELGMKLERIIHSRHIIWTDILCYFSEQNLITRLLGIDLGTEYMHTSMNVRAHSQYIKQIYATGYAGCICMFFLAKKAFCLCCDRLENKESFAGIIVWIALLGFGFSIESLEATQMSWFPMLYLAVMASEQEQE